MEIKVKTAPWQEVPNTDLNDVSNLAEASVDAIVKELLFDEGRYTGFVATRVDAMNLTIGAGRYYVGGRVYRAGAVTDLSVVSLLPVSDSRIVLVVVSGSTTETAVEVRNFLVSVEPREFQPKPTSTRIVRQASVELVAGAASAAPVRPAVPAGAIVVASFVLGSAGIDGAITAESANAALSLEKATTSIALLSARIGAVQSLLQTLRSDLAGLAKAQAGKADLSRMRAVETALMAVREHLDLPDERAIDGFDDFTTASETDTDVSTAVVEAGRLGFGTVERARRSIALLNPTDTKVDRSPSGPILPAATDVARISCDDKDGEVAFASQQVVTTTLRRLTLGRRWTWYRTWARSSFTADYLRDHSAVRVWDPAADVWETVDVSAPWWRMSGVSSKHVWRLGIDGAYWDVGASDHVVTGVRLAQSFLVAQSGWHRRLDLGFTAVGATGDVHVALCMLGDDGTPDFQRCLAIATVAVGDLQIWPAKTPFLFDPVWLDRGDRIGLVMVTTGNHKLAVSSTNDLTNGALATWVGGSVWVWSTGKDACFTLYGCRFTDSTVTVDIEDLTLAGGILEVQSAVTGHVPPGTSLTVQVRVGGVWRNLDETDETILVGAPTQLPARLVFQGSKDAAPLVDLVRSAFVVSRPATPSVHLSTERTLPVGVGAATVEVTEIAWGFHAARHNWDVTLLTGADFATEVTPMAVKTSIETSGTLTWTKRRWTFSGLGGIDAYKVRTSIATTDPATPFEIENRQDWAVAA